MLTEYIARKFSILQVPTVTFVAHYRYALSRVIIRILTTPLLLEYFAKTNRTFPCIYISVDVMLLEKENIEAQTRGVHKWNFN